MAWQEVSSPSPIQRIERTRFPATAAIVSLHYLLCEGGKRDTHTGKIKPLSTTTEDPQFQNLLQNPSCAHKVFF